MMAFIKKLWRDKRGNALIIAGASLPLLMGSVGLATDTVQWSLWKRQLQRSADSAAIAGVAARMQSASSGSAVTRDLTNNNHLWVSLLGGYPQVTEPTDTATTKLTVQVGLAVQRSLSFSSMFLSSAPVISVSARAAAVPDGLFCVVALETENTAGLIIQGSADVNMGCGMISNSPSSSVSVDVNGNAHHVTAEPVAGVGGVPDINGVTAEESGHLAQLDPYAGKYSTTKPADMSCNTMDNHEVLEVPNDNSVKTLSAGCYSGTNQFKFTNGTTVLQPGTYYLDSIDFDVSGNANISGDGVTIILTGSTPGQIKLNGGGNIVLAAPSAGDFANMLLMQSPSAANIAGNVINGSSGLSLDGRIYFPNQQMTFTGSAGASTKCAMVVARRVEFAGSTNIQNNTTGCHHNDQVAGQMIRLIA